MIDKEVKDFVFSRIGMALISAQRVEFITGHLLELLAEFDKDVYGITTPEFLSNSQKAMKARKTLGAIFTLLKLNPRWVIADELEEYLKMRNMLVHGFWRNYLDTVSEAQVKKAIDFCYEFGRKSDAIESFFKGFVFLLALRHVKDRDQLGPEFKDWGDDFDYFMASLQQQRLITSP
tara:strand:- start:461 stop:991 length:531 start_codon:yes stop_codon:yes gene_type:complete